MSLANGPGDAGFPVDGFGQLLEPSLVAAQALQGRGGQAARRMLLPDQVVFGAQAAQLGHQGSGLGDRLGPWWRSRGDWRANPRLLFRGAQQGCDGSNGAVVAVGGFQLDGGLA